MDILNIHAMLEKNFDAWNVKKQKTHALEQGPGFYYHDREVWWCTLGLNVGREEDGKHGSFTRPVLILKKFSKDLFWGVPLTSKIKTGPFYLQISHPEGVSCVILTQLKAFSSKRLTRRIGYISKKQFQLIHQKMSDLLSKD